MSLPKELLELSEKVMQIRVQVITHLGIIKSHQGKLSSRPLAAFNNALSCMEASAMELSRAVSSLETTAGLILVPKQEPQDESSPPNSQQ